MEVFREREQARPYQTATLRPTADASGASAVAGGMRSIGQGLGQLGDAIGARDVLLADTEAKERKLAYMRDRNDYLYGANGVMNRRGGNATELVPEVQQGLADLQKKHSADLSPLARRAFDDAIEPMRVSDEEGVARFSSAQTEQYVLDGQTSSIQTDVEAAGLAFADPVKFEEHLGAAMGGIDELAALQGWAPEKIELEKRKATSSAVMARILRTGATDPLAAAAILEENRGRLSPEHQQTLDTGLQDAVATAKARAFVSDYIGPPGATPAAQRAAAPSGGMSAIVRQESGGNPRAKNPDSSAYGTHQFLRGTYIGEVRKMQRQGLAPWADGLSEDQIAATRANPEIEGQVAQFFTANNERVIQSFGLPVNDATRYVMHFFGEGNGPKILRALAKAPGTPLSAIIDVAAITGPRSNKWVKGHETAGQVLDRIGRMLGTDPRSAAGNFVDVQGATQAILTIEDPLVQQKAMQQLSAMMTLENNAKEALSQQAFMQAWTEYKVNGTTEIPLDMQLAMGPGKLAALNDTISKEMSGALRTDPGTYTELTNMASVDPKLFAETDLAYYYPSLTEADRRHFTDLQAAARGKITGDANVQKDPMKLDFKQNWDDVQDIFDVADLRTTDKNETTRQRDRERLMNLRRQYEQWQMDFVRREGRHPNRVELQDAARDLVTPVVIRGDGWLGGKTEAIFADTATMAPGDSVEFDVDVTDIPAEEKASIVAQLEHNGVAVNSETVVAAAKERMLLTLRGGATSINEVPAEFRAAAKVRQGTGAQRTDREIVILYNEYLVEKAQEAQQIDEARVSSPPSFVPYAPPSLVGADDDQTPEAPALQTAPYGGVDETVPADLNYGGGEVGLPLHVRPYDLQ